jgi:hypothetical protein
MKTRTYPTNSYIPWVISMLVGVMLFAIVRPALADNPVVGLPTSYLSTDLLGSTVVNGYQQIYLKRSGVTYVVTSDSANHTGPVGNGQYLAYAKAVNGINQIYRYDLVTQTNIPITSISTNQRAKVSSTGKIVWERWVTNRWQVFYFDGSTVTQLTTGDVAVNALFESSGNIVFSRQTSAGVWRAERYTVSTGTTATVTTSQTCIQLKLVSGTVACGT